MIVIESLRTETVDDVVARVVAHQRAVAQQHPFINSAVDDAFLVDALLSAAPDVFVASRDGHVVGHLRGTTLDSEVFGRSVWINPEGLSYDDDRVLEELYVAMANRCLADHATRHYVWVPDTTDEILPWLRLGFAFMHLRGSRRLDDLNVQMLPTGYSIRRGSIADLQIAMVLDDHLRAAQELGPSYALGLDDSSQRDDWVETLEDPTVYYVVVEVDGAPVAQCATFPLPERVGTFPHSIHLSAVTVREGHRRLGLARAMVDAVLANARDRGYTYAETNWRVTNRNASRYWMNYGFTPTYIRLHRNVGVG